MHKYKLYNVHKLKKFLLNDFIHPNIKKRLKIHIEGSLINFYIDDQIVYCLYDTWDFPFYFKHIYEEGNTDDYYDRYGFVNEIYTYMNYKHHVTSDNTKIVNRILALLDRRTGKRTLQKYIQDGDYFKTVVIDHNKKLQKIYEVSFDAHNITGYK